LIESELFGHVKGAFTGADRDRIGAFEEADGGTLFLDEIGEMPLEMQPKLLRVLESGELRRIGENRRPQIDVGGLPATNRPLEREINHGRFREDLYFRLSVVTVRLPALRDRLDDLSMLVDVLLGELDAADKAHLFTEEVLAELARYDWPGNVRELKNYVERAVVLENAPPASVRGSSLARPAAEQPVNLDLSFTAAKEEIVLAFERRYLVALLTWAGGNISRAARKAGMDRMYLHRLLQRHDMHGGSFKSSGGADRKG